MKTQPRFQQTFFDETVQRRSDAGEVTTTTPDGIIDKVETKIYDEKGNLLRESSDFTPGDGVEDEFTRYVYDTNGNRIGLFESSGFEQEATYDYDTEGNLKITYTDVRKDEIPKSGTYSYTFDAKGNETNATTPEGSTRSDYTYNEAGKLVAVLSTPADGSPGLSSLKTFTYDAAGNINSDRVETFNASGDPISNVLTTYSYDETGKLVYKAADNNGDGVSEAATSYAYDAAGNEIYKAEVSGFETKVTSSAYDAAGNLVYQSEKGNDGLDKNIKTFAYDEAGNQIYAATDLDGDGQNDSILYRTFSDVVPESTPPVGPDPVAPPTAPQPLPPIVPDPMIPTDPQPTPPIVPDPEIPTDPLPEPPFGTAPESPVDPQPTPPVGDDPAPPVTPLPAPPVGTDPAAPVDPVPSLEDPTAPIPPEPKVPGTEPVPVDGLPVPPISLTPEPVLPIDTQPGPPVLETMGIPANEQPMDELTNFAGAGGSVTNETTHNHSMGMNHNMDMMDMSGMMMMAEDANSLGTSEMIATTPFMDDATNNNVAPFDTTSADLAAF
jgi:YD repeat-containing protein